jgi:hypothetical protein
MLLVTAKVLDAGRKFAETNDSPGSLPGWQLCVAQRAYSVTHDIGIAPTMATLQSTHDFPRVFIESGMYYIVHVYNTSKVYR